MAAAGDLYPSEYWHVFCQQFFDVPDAPPRTPLDEEGFARLLMLPPQAARVLRRHLEMRANDGNTIELRSRHQDFMYLPEADAPLLMMMLGKILDSAAGALLRQHFQSEFMVLWLKFFATYPGARDIEGGHEPGNPTGRPQSTLWHRDAGGAPYLHVLVYLNDHSEHGAATSFLDLAASRRIVAAGHDELDLELVLERDHDSRFVDVATAAGAAYAPASLDLDVGEGVAFNALDCFHREELPTVGPRYAMVMAAVPSPLPWRDAHAASPIRTWNQHGERGWTYDFRDHLIAAVQARGLAPRNNRWKDLAAGGAT